MIASQLANHVLRITINRPERRNALTDAMYTALVDELDRAAGDSAVRVAVVRGANGVFTAGNDVADFVADRQMGDHRPVLRFVRRIATFEKPLVAIVEGLAVGIGVTMLLHCDFVLAADNARFSLPFSQLALCPEAGSSLLLPLAAGHRDAADRLMLGEPFDAEEARRMGIVGSVHVAAELDTAAKAKLDRLVALPPISLRATKRLLLAARQDLLARAIEAERSTMDELVRSDEATEAFSAFAEKRKPDFSRFS
jgi:enoyl-CoA hydratase/carnithine racemase